MNIHTTRSRGDGRVMTKPPTAPLPGRLIWAGKQYARLSRASSAAIDAAGSRKPHRHSKPQEQWQIDRDKRAAASYAAAIAVLRDVTPDCRLLVERVFRNAGGYGPDQSELLTRALEALARHFWGTDQRPGPHHGLRRRFDVAEAIAPRSPGNQPQLERVMTSGR